MANTSTFLVNLGRSGLLETAVFTAIREDLWAEGMEHEADEVIADVLVHRGELTQWQAERLLAGKFRGFRLGDYRLLDLLGEGGMGSVYLAEHSDSKNRLAIKVLALGAHDENEERLERFRREAETISKLSHDNIIGAIEIHLPTDDCETTYLVMELVEGVTFERLVANTGPLDFQRTTAYLIQACRGLQHAHSRGFIHRDVKPSNLMVRRTGKVKLLDLGLASSPEQQLAERQSSTIDAFVGTADYVSPEQARNNLRIDSRSDIYSLGCTAYYLLAGRPPFVEKSVASRLVAHQMYEPTRLEELRPDIPAELTAIVNRMMAKDSSERYRSAGEVEAVLQSFFDEIADGKTVEIAPPSAAAEKATGDAFQSGEPTIRVPGGLCGGRFSWLPWRAAVGAVASWFSIFSTR